jgi:hypothetical protein
MKAIVTVLCVAEIEIPDSPEIRSLEDLRQLARRFNEEGWPEIIGGPSSESVDVVDITEISVNGFTLDV